MKKRRLLLIIAGVFIVSTTIFIGCTDTSDNANVDDTIDYEEVN